MIEWFNKPASQSDIVYIVRLLRSEVAASYTWAGPTAA